MLPRRSEALESIYVRRRKLVAHLIADRPSCVVKIYVYTRCTSLCKLDLKICILVIECHVIAKCLKALPYLSRAARNAYCAATLQFGYLPYT